MANYHVPILVDAVISGLDVKPGRQYIDATVGDGGHTAAILERGGKVLGLDRDPEQLDRSRLRLGKYIETGQLMLVETNFKHMTDVIKNYKYNPIDGILFDLGISSYHLDTSTRGFSFRSSQPLDMRLSPSEGVTAADLVNALSENELTELFITFGQVQNARAIAKAITRARREQRISTTTDLVRIIEGAAHRSGKLHPATKVFMSLRIAVNDEMHLLSDALTQAIDLLSPGGRLAVISFHEGEDRIVKQTFKSSTDVTGITKKPIVPAEDEISLNPRSRSAKLRVVEKREVKHD